MKHRILILYTGGTIGMAPSAQGYIPCPKFSQQLLQKIPEESRQQLPDFTVLEFSQLLDSANLQPSHWTEMAKHLMVSWDQYDGFVVLHGTDTMAYTAAALSFMLQGIDKPVILTGSQVPLMKLRSDGLHNLMAAMELAAHGGVAEVCIFFNNRLLRGNRSIKINSGAFDAFDSPNFPCLAHVGVEVKIEKHLLLKPQEKQFSCPVFDSSAVGVLHIYPGLNCVVVQHLLEIPTLKGVIILSYGVGNIPQHPSIIDALQAAGQRGVVMINITQCVEGSVNQGNYATGDSLNRIGVVAGGDLTLAAAFAKLHFLIGSGLAVDCIREQLALSLCGEMT
ncbi:MAG: asparaginase [Spongiibacteraceae bacterium]|nr:asparaginase [Spongiibacteraceae bacterium]